MKIEIRTVAINDKGEESILHTLDVGDMLNSKSMEVLKKAIELASTLTTKDNNSK